MKPVKCRSDKTKEYLKELEIDSLLYNFRVVANVDTKNSKPYERGEVPEVGIRGHFVGYYISTCSKFAYGDNNEEFKNIAFNFYEFLLGRIFANGNSSSKAPNGNLEKTSAKAEYWGEYGILTDKLTGGESESCCAHNTEKILNKLFRYSNDVRYLNHLDDLKFNSILSSISYNSGLSQYHQPMGVGAKKNFATKFDSFWCCMGSGIEAMSELQNNIYFYDDNKVLVNSLINSELKFKNVKLTMVTNYPNSLRSTLEFSMEEDTVLNIILI